MYLTPPRNRRGSGGIFIRRRFRIPLFDPIGLISGAVLMDAAHDHHPHPFTPVGWIAGAVLMDASRASS